MYEMIPQLAVVDGDVRDRFGIDAVEMGRSFPTPPPSPVFVLYFPPHTPCQEYANPSHRRSGS
jgi:hypothetical protein